MTTLDKPRSKQKQRSKMGMRYELAYFKVQNDMPDWKKTIIESSDPADEYTKERLLQDFAKEVICLAESEQEILLTT